MIIYDPDANPKNEEQAIARAHRIGQNKEVRVFHLEMVRDAPRESRKRKAGSQVCLTAVQGMLCAVWRLPREWCFCKAGPPVGHCGGVCSTCVVLGGCLQDIFRCGVAGCAARALCWAAPWSLQCSRSCQTQCSQGQAAMQTAPAMPACFVGLVACTCIAAELWMANLLMPEEGCSVMSRTAQNAKWLAVRA